MSNVPMACALTPGQLEAARGGLLPGVVARATDRIPLPDGVCWTFPSTAGLVTALGRVIDRERQCCPFLRFLVRIDAEAGCVSLEVTGPPGTRAFLEALTDGATAG